MDKLFGRLGFRSSKDKDKDTRPSSSSASGAGTLTPPSSSSARSPTSSTTIEGTGTSGSTNSSGENRRGGHQLQREQDQQQQQQQQRDRRERPKSDFYASALDAQRMGLQQGLDGNDERQRMREIDENTPLDSLTNEERRTLQDRLLESEWVDKYPITGPFHINIVRERWKSNDNWKPIFRKLQWLEANGWDQVWEARGDGDCFYRSFTIGYLLRILYAPDPATAAAASIDDVDHARQLMVGGGFQEDIADEFLRPFFELIASFIAPDESDPPTAFSITRALQNVDRGNKIVLALRYITSAYIRINRNEFSNFLFSPSTFELASPEEFCAAEVEPLGKYADQPMITALSAALRVPLRVAYLDRTDVGEEDVINWVPFGDAVETNRPITLLYRPGHFDVVTRDNEEIALRREAIAASTVQAAQDLRVIPPAAGGSTSAAPRRSSASRSPKQTTSPVVPPSPLSRKQEPSSPSSPTTNTRFPSQPPSPAVPKTSGKLPSSAVVGGVVPRRLSRPQTPISPINAQQPFRPSPSSSPILTRAASMKRSSSQSSTPSADLPWGAQSSQPGTAPGSQPGTPRPLSELSVARTTSPPASPVAPSVARAVTTSGDVPVEVPYTVMHDIPASPQAASHALPQMNQVDAPVSKLQPSLMEGVESVKETEGAKQNEAVAEAEPTATEPKAPLSTVTAPVEPQATDVAESATIEPIADDHIPKAQRSTSPSTALSPPRAPASPSPAAPAQPPAASSSPQMAPVAAVAPVAPVVPVEHVSEDISGAARASTPPSPPARPAVGLGLSASGEPVGQAMVQAEGEAAGVPPVVPIAPVEPVEAQAQAEQVVAPVQPIAHVSAPPGA